MSDTKPPEPSIEEILASIRKIISDDEPDTGHEDVPGDEDVLELTDEVFAVPQNLPRHEPSAHYPDPDPAPIPRDEPSHQPEPIPHAPLMAETQPHHPEDDHREDFTMPSDFPEVPAPTPGDGEGLASDATMAAASGALAKLAHADHPLSAAAASGSGKTVEDIVRELLRPVLRQWIDQNLPPLVERLVERELKRISRKVEDI